MSYQPHLKMRRHEAVRRLRTLIGLSEPHLSYIVHHASINLDNPLRDLIDYMSGVNQNTDANGIKHARNSVSVFALPDYEVKDAEKSLINFMYDKNADGVSTQGEADRRRGWTIMGKIFEKLKNELLALFGFNVDDSLIVLIFGCYGANLAPGRSRLRILTGTTLPDPALTGVLTCCRFSLGVAMGWLNLPSNDEMRSSALDQLPKVFKTSLNPQARLQHYFLSAPFSTPALLRGEGLLPFSLSGYGDWPQSRAQLEMDGEATDRAFRTALTECGMEEQEARLLLRESPYFWIRHNTPDDGPILTLMKAIFANLQQGPCYGLTQVIWDDIVQHLEIRAAPRVTFNQLTPSEDRELRRLKEIARRPDPSVIIKALPHTPIIQAYDKYDYINTPTELARRAARNKPQEPRDTAPGTAGTSSADKPTMDIKGKGKAKQ